MISEVEQWIANRTGLFGNLNNETLYKWQQEKLEKQIQYARKNTKFYSEKLKNKNHFQELPFTLPSEIANDPYAFLAICQSDVFRVTTLSNSGTTHLKKRIFFSKNDLERTIDFFAVGMSNIVKKGDRAQILISNRTENSLGSLLKESLSRISTTSEITGVVKSVSAAIESSIGADCLIGMPAEILYMSHIAPNFRPKNVLLAADYIPKSLIENIKQIWNCNVFSHYGHSEFGYGVAVDCQQHCGHHIRDIDLIIEIINPETGRPVNIGESGEIVITTLSNEAMPLIRYRTGNISSIINETCGCGGLLPRLGKIEGRYANIVHLEDGNKLSINQLDEVIFAKSFVRSYNAALKYDGKKYLLILTVDADDKIDLHSLSSELPPLLNIEIRYDKVDPFSDRGKRHLIIG